MADLTNHAEALILKWLMTDETVTRPPAAYLALFSSATGEGGGGTELSGSGYARQAIDFGTDGATNASDVIFTAAGGDWATATHHAIFDAVSGGNMLWQKAMPASKQLDDGDTLTYPAGDIDLALD
jgi:hypothetical protein